MLRKVARRFKDFMNDKVKTCKEVLSTAQGRLVAGLVMLGAGVGIGGALIASAYIQAPAH